jgi:hypothetical protein
MTTYFKHKALLSTLGVLAAAWMPGAAQAQFSASVGADYSSGKYGSQIATKVWSVPLTGRYETGPLTLKLSVPWLRIDNAGGVIPVLGNGGGAEHAGSGAEDHGGRGSSSVGGGGSGSGGTVGQFGCAFDNRKGAKKVESTGPCAGFTTGVGGGLVAPAAPRTEAGWGDVAISATYGVYEDKASGMTVDLTGRAKFATASVDRGLGSGKNDYAVQGDINRDFQRVSVFATLGYKWLGKPDGVELKNVVYASLGSSYKLTDTGTLGASYDIASAAVSGAPKPSEASVYFTQKFTKTDKLNVYLLKGFSDASPDWGGGLKYSHTF